MVFVVMFYVIDSIKTKWIIIKNDKLWLLWCLKQKILFKWNKHQFDTCHIYLVLVDSFIKQELWPQTIYWWMYFMLYDLYILFTIGWGLSPPWMHHCFWYSSSYIEYICIPAWLTSLTFWQCQNTILDQTCEHWIRVCCQKFYFGKKVVGGVCISI